VLKLHSLEYRRIFNDSVLCCKILNGNLVTQLWSVFELISNSRTRGHAFKLIIIILLIIIIIIIIAPLTIVSEDQWGDLECLYKVYQAARTDGSLFTDIGEDE